MPIIRDENVLSGTVSGGVVTADVDLKDHDGFVVGVAYSGSGISGKAKLQASQDQSTYDDIPESLLIISATGMHLWDMAKINFRYLRLYCESVSGAITFTGRVTIKEGTRTGK